MSLVHTVTTTAAPITSSTKSTAMPSHPSDPTSASSAAMPSQSLLLAPLQSSTSSNVAITPSKARKQAQAQRTRLVALSKHLMTRLQYANFKVEHGWSKQSLSEVENLYYRQNQSAGTTSNATARTQKSNSTSPANGASKAPATPSAATAHGQKGVGSRLFKDAAIKKIDVEGGDVFGGYGLATPPASAGSAPGATSYLSSKRGRSTSSTPISPPNTSAHSSASKGGDAASAPKRSPNGNSHTSGSGSRASHVVASGATKVSNPPAAAGGATSYADFWSRVGSSAAASSTAVNAASSRSASPSKKRSADDVVAADGANGSDASAAHVSPAGKEGGSSSPSKRVRMDTDADRTSSWSATSSPAKAALAERGPSFASSVRRH
ncbi:hypothetical protein PANT_13c00085 [Moesziomyces antarcticus T-34]|uniref:Uncharacterized protein n=1 Tax=Pseudozyma antarctica (strain T-34) TaxID=1151754 RepID=M9ME27_PSEA3|nr:hypothetical protein PANT_13c00085 [Moesziomyces antarcticus T-34]